MAKEMRPILFSCINEDAVDQALIWLQSLKMSYDKFPQNKAFTVDLWCTAEVEQDPFKRLFPEVNLRLVKSVNVVENGLGSRSNLEGMSLRLQALDIYHLENPEGIQLLYTDTDLVINGDISSLANPPFKPDQWLAASSDFPHLGEMPFTAAYSELVVDWERRMSINERYFNSGVMVIKTEGLYRELTKWGLTSLVDFFEKYRNMCYFPDQDALNKLAQNYLEMPRSFNAFPEYHIHPVLPIDKLMHHRQRLVNAHVIHFLGMAKPWKKARMVNRVSIQLPYEVYWKYMSPIINYLSPKVVEGVQHNLSVNGIIIEQAYQKHLREII